MALRKLKPTTPGQRGASIADFSDITRQTPEKSLVRPIKSKGGRNASGKITTRHPVSPWGKPEARSRKKKASDQFIVRRRPANKSR